jgi:hypothetical protein
MSKRSDWRSYISETGDFELPNYLYRIINDLMKQSLDLGTMISDDKVKLRAYKEQVKRTFRSRWFDVAEALQYFDIIEPCVCQEGEFCRICGGSRYRLSAWLTPDEMQQISMAFAVEQSDELITKLQEGLKKALVEVQKYGLPNLPV